jgi:hypothetical protein
LPLDLRGRYGGIRQPGEGAFIAEIIYACEQVTIALAGLHRVVGIACSDNGGRIQPHKLASGGRGPINVVSNDGCRSAGRPTERGTMRIPDHTVSPDGSIHHPLHRYRIARPCTVDTGRARRLTQGAPYRRAHIGRVDC